MQVWVQEDGHIGIDTRETETIQKKREDIVEKLLKFKIVVADVYL